MDAQKMFTEQIRLTIENIEIRQAEQGAFWGYLRERRNS